MIASATDTWMAFGAMASAADDDHMNAHGDPDDRVPVVFVRRTITNDPPQLAVDQLR